MRAILVFVVNLAIFSSLAASSSEYEAYWNEWHIKVIDFNNCKTENVVTEFLEKASENLGNAERTEANSEAIEHLILDNPACFCRAYNKLTNPIRQKIGRNFIETPIFNDKKVIEEALISSNQEKACGAF